MVGSINSRQKSFSYHYMSEYLPVRYEASYEQRMARKTVYDFKDGRASTSLLSMFIREIRNMIGYNNASDYCICFIPASEHYKTIRRYNNLANRIRTEIGCSCNVDTITCPDHESGHIVGKSSNPTAGYQISSNDVSGKKVILIDDVITRGTTFYQTAELLMGARARDVQGLFLAKTVNPDWNSRVA